MRALPDRDRRLARAIASTALRRHGEVHALLDRLIEKKPPRSRDFFHVLEIAVTQVLFMEVADHASVSLAIDQIAADPKARHLKGLANAVLRRIARERDALLAYIDSARLDAPDWLWDRWCATYGEETARAIAEAHLGEAPLDLSVKDDPAGWAETLGGGVTATGSVRLAEAGRRRAASRLRRGRLVGPGHGGGAARPPARRRRRQARRRSLRGARRQDR